MITLYRHPDDPQADRLEEIFRDLVLAYKSVSEPERTELCIQEGDRKISEQKEIDRWLLQLRKELDWQRSLSGDGCYIDPDSGETC